MTSSFSSNAESEAERLTCRLAWEHLGIQNDKLKSLSRNGMLDRIFWIPGGKPLLIEFKLPGEDPRPNQKDIHDELRNLGYDAQVHDNAADAFQAIIEAVEPACVSKTSRKILARARRCCAVLRSRSG